jgi:hypothetical protein
MEEIKKMQSIFIAKDGKKFNSKSACQNHEDELDRIEYKNKIKTMNLDELNIQIINFLGEKNKQYSKDLNDAFEIAEKRELFVGEEYYLYKDYTNNWCIGHMEWESIQNDIIADTIPEAICRVLLLQFHKLL